MTAAVYVLTLVLAGASVPVDLGRYDSETECTIQARSVRVHHRGARLKCVPAPMTAEERQAGALLVGGAP